MSVRSVRGFLLVVLAVVAALALPLLALAMTADPFSEWVADARQLVGWRISVVLLSLGAIGWLVVAGAEVALGRWGRRLAVAGLVVFAAPGYLAWSDRYVERNGIDTIHPVSSVRSPSLQGSEWRGYSAECSWVTYVALRFVSDSVAVGRVRTGFISELMPAVLEFGSLDGPDSQPVRAILRDGMFWITIPEWDEPMRLTPIGLPRAADIEGIEGP